MLVTYRQTSVTDPQLPKLHALMPVRAGNAAAVCVCEHKDANCYSNEYIQVCTQDKFFFDLNT